MSFENRFDGGLSATTVALALLCAPVLLTGCVANSYAGVSLAAGAADPDLQALVLLAQAGDRRAQLQLGIMYEEGRGLRVDLSRAARLYRSASRDSSGTTYVYAPPAGRHGRGRVRQFGGGGAPQHGLPEAIARLAAMRMRESGQGLAPSGEGEGDRGFRAAEEILAAAIDIRRTRQSYLGEVPAASQAFCGATRHCSWESSFGISLGVRTRVGVLFSLDLPGAGDARCDRVQADNSCEISAAVVVAGDETFPHCVGTGPVYRRAASIGWRIAPNRYADDFSVSRYKYMGDSDFTLFIRTLRDARCVHNIYIRRIAPTHSARN